MIQSIQFSIRLTSENQMRGFRVWAQRHRETARQRGIILAVLNSQLTKPPMSIGRDPNRFDVRLERISSGALDPHDGLPGACKTAVDAIAEWLGIDDGDPFVRWQYGQFKCERGFQGVRITITDDAPGPELHRVLHPAPKRLVQVPDATQRGRARRTV